MVSCAELRSGLLSSAKASFGKARCGVAWQGMGCQQQVASSLRVHPDAISINGELWQGEARQALASLGQVRLGMGRKRQRGHYVARRGAFFLARQTVLIFTTQMM